MPKLKNIKTLLKNKSKLRGAINQVLFGEKISAIQGNYKISSFPVISFSELFKMYPDADPVSPIRIRTDFTNGSSPLNDYFFLCKILQAIGASNYFEIGTWVGLSAMNLAINSPTDINIYTLDLNEDHRDLVSFDIPKEVFGRHSMHIPNIKHLKGDSKLFDFSPYNKKMDMVFVDGSHSLDYVTNDTQKAFELLKDNFSVIVWHDYLIGGEINAEVLCGILNGLPRKEHKHLYHLDQSNIAVFSKSFFFRHRAKEKWNKPEMMFEVNISASNSSESGDSTS
jgi:predicted O-methyltransferase YrrM